MPTETTTLLVTSQDYTGFFSDVDVKEGTIGSNGSLVGNSQEGGKTRYKVLGLSEGIHNGLRVLREDIEQMAHDVSVSTETIPVVLDHSFNWNDVVGKVLGVTYLDSYIAPDGKQLNGALLMDIELLPPSDNTPKLNETLYRLEKLPELAKFSVAFKFTPITDENGNITVHDLVLKHLAIVTNPADSSTQILEKLSSNERTRYMTFDLNAIENINGGKIMPTTKPRMHTARYAARRNARFNNPTVDAIARNPLTPGTYPIADVSSIAMKVGQRSPLACGCGDELYERQNAAQFAKRRNAARLAAQRRARNARFASQRRARFAQRRPSARFARRNTAKFTQYGVPTVYGNPWEFPVSDTYPNVNQLIALRKKQAALKARARLGRRAKLLEERDGAKFAHRRNARFASRRARFDDEFVPAMEPVVDAPIAKAPIADGFAPVAPMEPAPAFDVPMNTAIEGNVSEYQSMDMIPTDPVVQAYVDAGLIVEDEIPVVEVALRQHRAAKFAARRAQRARFARKAAHARFAQRPSARRARFAQRPTARRARFAQRPVARRARFAQRPSARRARFEGLINEYMVPSANLPRRMNVNIRDADNAQFARRASRARFGARAPARRSGSFFADGGVRREQKVSDVKVPQKVTSIAPENSASASPATFVGNQSCKSDVIKELNECKAKLAQAENLSVLRAQALSMQFADKDFIMTLTEDQLNKYIASKGAQQAAFSAQMNPFANGAQNDKAKMEYIAEFADSFTKGSYNTIATIDQISSNSEAKAKQIFGGN